MRIGYAFPYFFMKKPKLELPISAHCQNKNDVYGQYSESRTLYSVKSLYSICKETLHFFYVKNYDFADYQLYVVIGTPNAIH